MLFFPCLFDSKGIYVWRLLHQVFLVGGKVKTWGVRVKGTVLRIRESNLLMSQRERFSSWSAPLTFSHLRYPTRSPQAGSRVGKLGECSQLHLCLQGCNQLWTIGPRVPGLNYVHLFSFSIGTGRAALEGTECDPGQRKHKRRSFASKTFR